MSASGSVQITVEPTVTGFQIARITLVVIGVLGIGWGAYVMFDSVRIGRIPGVALWIGAAIVLHDGIISPLVFALGVMIRRAGRRMTGTIIAVVQGAIVVGSIMSLIVVPAIAAQNYAPENSSLLPFDYGMHLGIFWVVIAALAFGLSLWLYLRTMLVRTKRANQRSSTRQS